MLARKFGAAWEIFAPAKLNLYLEVLGRRDDGFHELETLMAPIRLFDRLAWRPAAPDRLSQFSLRYDPSTAPAIERSVPLDEENLIWRAARLLAQVAGIEPTGEITLTKRIPAQAGLGGGSSDAAATLQLLNSAWGIGFPRSRLAELAAQLGSDVPFFLTGQSAVCRGRGEIIDPAPAMPRLNAVIVCPPAGVSTAAAFNELDSKPRQLLPQPESRRRIEMLVNYLRTGSLAAAGRLMGNRLQAASERLCPAIGRLGTAFASCGCYAHLLAGSGSAYFGIFRSARHARRAASLLGAAALGTVYVTATCR